MEPNGVTTTAAAPRQTRTDLAADEPVRFPPELTFRAPVLARRLVVLAGAVLLFIGVGSIFQPEPTPAQTGPESGLVRALRAGGQPGTPAATNSAPAPVHPRGLPVLGELRGTTYRTWIYGSADAPRFTICDAAGAVLAEDLTAEQAYTQFPDLDIKGMILPPADASKPVMLADQKD